MVVLGKGVTDSNGRWTIHLSQRLPPAARKAADRNGGILNTLAMATTVAADGVFESAVVEVPVTVGPREAQSAALSPEAIATAVLQPAPTGMPTATPSSPA